MNLRFCIRLISSILLIISSEFSFSQPIGSLVFRDVYVVPHDFRYDGTQVGGLSGVDYDAKSGTCYFICDDRSSLQPARYYEATVKFSDKGIGIDTVLFTAKINLLGPDGKPFAKNTLDPEALRFNSQIQEVVWTSEGERIVKETDTVLTNPGIFVALNGKYLGEYEVPANVRVTAAEYGARNNGAFEAMTFADNFKTLWVGLEEPLYQDGPRADVEESMSPVRFFRYDVRTRKNTVQYAYDLESVAFAPILTTAFRVNGVTDILEAGPNQLLVVERSFTTGRLPCTVKIFLADLSNATDVKDIPSLKGIKFQPVTKKLLLNMDDLNMHIDNVEGVTWGPVLPNGNRTLLLITDNNFQSIQKTQLFLLEVISGK